jgi:4-methyl-5(b-hydroxyethyl)-thiazole monophosphate biosynthesis
MKVLLFCAKGFETMECSVFVDVFGWARNDFGCQIAVDTCGFTKTVVSTFGIPIVVDKCITEIDVNEYDALAIPGGFEEFGFYDEAYDAQLSALINAFEHQKKPIAAICVGALALGKSGILMNRKATTYHLKNGYRQKELATFGAKVMNERIVVDDTIITSYCPETSADVAFELLKMLAGETMMTTVKQAMGYNE